MTTFFYILFGFLSGILGGLGMGGGTILIPLLTIFVDLDQKMSQGINLIAFLIMALFSFLGAIVANIVSAKILKVCFGVFLILLSLEQIFKIFKKNKREER